MRRKEIERQFQVYNASIEFDGEVHSASYYIENNVIHANIGGRMIMTVLGSNPGSQTVKALLLAHLLQAKRKLPHRTQREVPGRDQNPRGQI